mmetsp:Transcript_27515/g.78525  ORF Transcript_27515/g.78525 Transcript_27515/m.78525 type:complete len:210 (-) Transcript_27515:28-657(-)
MLYCSGRSCGRHRGALVGAMGRRGTVVGTAIGSGSSTLRRRSTSDSSVGLICGRPSLSHIASETTHTPGCVHGIFARRLSMPSSQTMRLSACPHSPRSLMYLYSRHNSSWPSWGSIHTGDSIVHIGYTETLVRSCRPQLSSAPQSPSSGPAPATRSISPGLASARRSSKMTPTECRGLPEPASGAASGHGAAIGLWPRAAIPEIRRVER